MSRSLTPGRVFVRLLSPSWFETFVGLVVAFGVSVFFVTVALSKNPELTQYVHDLKASSSTFHLPSDPTYDSLINFINNSKLVGDATVFFVWAMVGLMAYHFVMFIWQLFSREAHFFETLGYTHTNKRQVLRDALIAFFVRTAATAGLVGSVMSFRNYVAPEFLSLALGAFSKPGIEATVSFILGALVLLGCMHVLVILARVMCLRTRVFYTRYSVME